MPDFKAERPDLTTPLLDVLGKALQRDREDRYQRAAELMIELERVLYSKGYGPTNEKLASYLRYIYRSGQAYEDDISELPVSIALNPEPDNT
jgi:serine/threonine-protein kinase